MPFCIGNAWLEIGKAWLDANCISVTLGHKQPKSRFMANHVSMAFCKATDSSLGVFASGVVAGLTDNSNLFPNPPVTPSSLGDARTSFVGAVDVSRQGSVAQTVAKNSLRAELIALLRTLATYVGGVANGDATVIRAAGFDVTMRGYNPQTPLPKPTELRIRLGQSTQLIVNVKRIKNARSYEVQMRAGGSWQSAGTFTQGRRMILEKLVPGTVYEIRVRAVGGSTGYSDWSDTTSHMCL